MLGLLRQFGRDTSGNFAIMTGLLLPLMLVATGAAVDFGIALTSSQRLSAAANGAVLAALSEVQVRTERGEEITEEAIAEAVEGFFLSNASNLPLTTLSSVTPRAEIARNEITATLSFQANYQTTLMMLFGRDTVPISNQAQATVTLRSYININILIDTSQSMGIGATDGDQQLVAQATGCAFACHINKARGSSSYDAARRNGATMRIDVARSAVAAAVDTIVATEEFPGQVTVGLYRFSNELTEILSPTDARAADPAYVKSLAQSQINLDMTYGGTNIEEALRQIATRMPASGNGGSPGDRIQYVVVVSDGVESGQAWLPNYWFLHAKSSPNDPKKAYAPHEVNYALNPSACDGLRRSEIDLYFIYTEYLEPKYGTINSGDRQRFDFISKSLFPIIPARMATCAGSTDHVLQASSPAQIHAAFEAIAHKLSSPLRLY
ncbi:TadE/TadG family type IV pilus assembly protein [Devosia sp.]|uniref:TadE/TadG family type IV pilus assembly protein n=1 Tax=Devosia sp. TaxID=1871048 RepID=UPI002FC5AFB7